MRNSKTSNSKDAFMRMLDIVGHYVADEANMLQGDEIEQVLINTTSSWHGENARQTTTIVKSDQQLRAGALCEEFLNFASLIDRLETFHVVFRRYPFRGTGIKRTDYLQMMQEFYLHEIYVLTERTKTLLQVAEKASGSEVTEAGVIIKRLKKSLDPWLRARNQHTHRHPYKDNNLDGIISLEFVAFRSDLVSLRPLFWTRYMSYRNNLVK